MSLSYLHLCTDPVEKTGTVMNIGILHPYPDGGMEASRITKVVATRCIASCREAAAPRAAVPHAMSCNVKLEGGTVIVCTIEAGWR